MFRLPLSYILYYTRTSIMGPYMVFSPFTVCTLCIFVLLPSIECQTRTKTDIVVYFLHGTPGDMLTAMNICGNSQRYLPVIDSEKKRLFYAAAHQKLTELVSSIAVYRYMFWTNATSNDGFTFYFDNYPDCTELSISSGLWSQRSFDYHKLGTLFVGPFTLTSSNGTNGNDSRYGLMPIIPIIHMVDLVICEREAGPCEFEQRDLGTCPSPINKEQVYHDVPLLPMCVEYCTSFTDGNFECWGILFTATQEECHLIVTENPATLTILQETVNCGTIYPPDMQYHVKICYSLSVDFYPQLTTNSSLEKRCRSSGSEDFDESTSATTEVSSAANSLQMQPTTVFEASLTASGATLSGLMSLNSNTSMLSKTTAFPSVTSEDLNLEPSSFDFATISHTTTVLTTSIFDPDMSQTEQYPVVHSASLYPYSSPGTILLPTYPFVTPSETVTTDTSQSLKLVYLRPCLCSPQNADGSSGDDRTTDIIQELTIDASKTSLRIRTKTTAKDKRSSSTAIGIVGVAALVIPGFLVVFSDIASILCSARTSPVK